MPPKREAGKKPRRVKGCHNCSQRRINCDRNLPCQKCINKGIECSGLGVRYRFNNGVASRGKLAGMTIPVTNTNHSSLNSFSDETQVAHSEPWEQKIEHLSSEPRERSLTPSAFRFQSNATFSEHMEFNIDHIDQQSRFLLEYFSQRVAPAMVAIDVHNGYRDILLPLSEYDETLRFAILAASAFHLAHQHPDPKWTSIARNYHMATINGLNQRSREQKENHITSDTFSNLSIMVVLLIEEMVTVGEDFPILLGMVRSFVSSRGGEEKLKESMIGRFLLQQIRKMTFYAAPLVSELSATTNLCNISATDLALLYSFQQTTPEWGTIIANIVDFVRKAAEIYLLRATNMPDALIHDQVQHFINAASLFNATSFGGHVLIWPFFIVGAECSDIRHREFIVTQLRYLWGCTGFANTLYAIRLLKKIWEDQSGMNWTKILVNNVEGFVM